MKTDADLRQEFDRLEAERIMRASTDPRLYGIVSAWADIADQPANRLLALADIGTRQTHYDFAVRFPLKYPGHTGGSLTCPHPDCRLATEAIIAAVNVNRLVTPARPRRLTSAAKA